MDIKKTIKKYFSSWKHFGTFAMVSKAWEKFIVDKYRFRIGIKRAVPNFPLRKTHNITLDVDEINIKENISICYLIHYFFPDKTGGTERFVLNLAKEQMRLGNKVRVLTLGKRELNEYSNNVGDIYVKDFIYEDIPITQIRYKKAPRGLYYDDINMCDKDMEIFAEAYLMENNFNIVHAAYIQPFTTFIHVCKRHSIPYIVTMTDFNILCHYATMVMKNGLFCSGSDNGKKCDASCKTYGVRNCQERYISANILLNNAEYLTVPSEFVARIIENEFKNVKVEVIPHGIGSNFYDDKRRVKTSRFMYAGTLSELKGVALLIRSFLKLEDKDITLDIYGDGEARYVNFLKKLANRDHRIKFRGNISADRISEAYNKSDCVIVPSIWFETYNFVLREALSCGCLAIAANIGAMPEAINENKNGFIFEAGNEESLLDALQKSRDFNWELYEQSRFPRTNEEGEKYNIIYNKVVEREEDNA